MFVDSRENIRKSFPSFFKFGIKFIELAFCRFVAVKIMSSTIPLNSLHKQAAQHSAV
jgi:hypothetical protein